MNISVVTNRTQLINDLHTGIQDKLRTAVSDAIEIGRLLSEQKAELTHGDWIPWLKTNVSFSERTARNYMRIFDHRDKTATVADLSQAYAMVETLEAQEKRQEKEQVQSKIDEHRAAGTKPKKTENRKVYEEYRKQEDQEAYKERLEEAFEEPDTGPDISDEELDRLVDDATRRADAYERHAHLNLSNIIDTSNQLTMFQAIERYINSFEDVSRQLEATHNLVKKLTEIGNYLQRVSAGTAP